MQKEFAILLKHDPTESGIDAAIVKAQSWGESVIEFGGTGKVWCITFRDGWDTPNLHVRLMALAEALTGFIISYPS